MKSKKGYLFIAPAVLHLVFFGLGPILFALYISFFKWHLLRDAKPFVGFANYQKVFGDGTFWKAMMNSAVFAGASVPLGMIAALLVALLVFQKMKGMAVFRTLFYVPSICSQVAIAMIWIYIYLPKSGFINTVLGMVGLPNGTDFLNEMGWAMAALVFMSIWTGLGPRMVLFLAGLAGIPQSLYEAAELDGATGLRAFWNVTLPLLAPTTLFVLITSSISAFQVFTPVYMMTKGGPVDSTDVIGYHIYIEAWQNFQVGTASAQSFVLLAVLAGLSFIQFRLMKSQLEGAGAA